MLESRISLNVCVQLQFWLSTNDVAAGALLPVTNHGLATMSMGYLLPKGIDTAVVWRGLMVQKAVQQLLFDVDWTGGLDVLVVDMPPGTGDVPLTLGQLVNVDGACLVRVGAKDTESKRLGYRVDAPRCRSDGREEGNCNVPQGFGACTSRFMEVACLLMDLGDWSGVEPVSFHL